MPCVAEHLGRLSSFRIGNRLIFRDLIASKIAFFDAFKGDFAGSFAGDSSTLSTIVLNPDFIFFTAAGITAAKFVVKDSSIDSTLETCVKTSLSLASFECSDKAVFPFNLSKTYNFKILSDVNMITAACGSYHFGK